jgi:type VI secretion system protein ImpE
MADADEMLYAGDLPGARKALVEIVRNDPQNEQARMFLFQLFALTGEWQKAKLQLTTLAQLSPEAQMLSVAYGQAIEAELQRADALAGKAPVPVHGCSEGWPVELADAIGHLARGEVEAGESLRNTAFDAAPDTPGRFNDVPFDWVADADPRFGPTCEAIIAGRWGLLPFTLVEQIESAGATALRDLVWYPVEIAFRSGQSIAAMLPSRYPGTESSEISEECMGQATRWTGDSGVGQHLLTFSSGEDAGLLTLRSMVFG